MPADGEPEPTDAAKTTPAKPESSADITSVMKRSRPVRTPCRRAAFSLKPVA